MFVDVFSCRTLATAAALVAFLPSVTAGRLPRAAAPAGTNSTAFCVDRAGRFVLETGERTDCATIRTMSDRTRRRVICAGRERTTGATLTRACPVACAHWKCYLFHGTCVDADGAFAHAGLGSGSGTCRDVGALAAGSEEKRYVCATYTYAGVGGATAPSGGALVQDVCPVACLSLECTCADKDIPFVSGAAFDAAGRILEDPQERTCASLYTLPNWEYRNVVCLLDIAAITPYFGDDPLKVYYMCPKACGFRKECFCRDSKAAVPLPVATPPAGTARIRRCRDAADDPARLGPFCDETRDPLFARSCPIVCGNRFCTEEDPRDSTDTLSFSFNNNIITTSCFLISMLEDSFRTRFCDARETDLQVKGSALCPITCTSAPTARPTARPTGRTTARPTSSPTGRPTGRPTIPPTGRPTVASSEHCSRIRLHWEPGYYWQESTREKFWCMSANRAGEMVRIRRCTGASNQRFRFVAARRHIQSCAHPALCLATSYVARWDEHVVRLAPCGGDDRRQEFGRDYQRGSGGAFRLEPEGADGCLTTEHHPKSQEIVYAYDCRQAEKDESVYWNAY